MDQTINNSGPREKISEIKTLILSAGFMYLLFLLYFIFVLKFDLFRSDVYQYWKESYNWRAPFSTWWVPGYSLLVALVRGLTFNLFPPLVIMWFISGISYVIAVVIVYKIIIMFNLKYAIQIALVFAVFPFVGLTESVNPRADITTTALLLLSLFFFEKKQWLAFTLASALCLITHKATWFFIPPLSLFAFFQDRKSRMIIPFSVIPLFAWMICGAVYYNDIFWFMHYGISKLIKSSSSIPVLDGLIGPFFSGSLPKMIKGFLVFLTFLSAIFSLIYSYRMHFRVGIILAISIIMMAISLNRYEIWAVVRFSKIMVVPLAFVLQNIPLKIKMNSNSRWALIILLFILTNISFGYYMANSQ